MLPLYRRGLGSVEPFEVEWDLEIGYLRGPVVEHVIVQLLHCLVAHEKALAICHIIPQRSSISNDASILLLATRVSPKVDV